MEPQLDYCEQTKAIHELSRQRPQCARDQRNRDAACRRMQQRLARMEGPDKYFSRPIHPHQSDRPDHGL